MLAALTPDARADAAHTEGAAPSLRAYALAGAVAGATVVAGAVVGGSSFVSHLPGAWFFGTPGGPLQSVSTSTVRAPALAILAVYGGLAALAVVWWKLLRALWRRPGVSVRGVAGVVGAWAVPFAIAPPLFSRDVYSYAGQGLLVSFHINPYAYGPGILGATPFNLLAGPLWANTPSPYGPLWLWIDGSATWLSGHEVLADLVLLRVVAVAGVALVAGGLPTLARSVGQDPAAAVVLGAGSPLVLATLVGGAHNDAVMVGLLVVGLAAWQRFGPVPGIVLCALAAGVKAPAALGVIVIGWNWAPAGARVPERMSRTMLALGIGTATLAAVSSVSGLGWGWLETLTAADKVSTGVTPVDAVAHVAAGALHLVGSTVSPSSVRSVVVVAGLAVAVGVGTALIWRSPTLGPLRALGGSLLLLALLSPVLWAWYLTWGVAVLAPVAAGRLRRLIVWVAIAEAIVGASSVLGVLRSLRDAGPGPVLLVAAGIAGLAYLAAQPSYEQGSWPWSRRDRGASPSCGGRRRLLRWAAAAEARTVPRGGDDGLGLLDGA